MVYAHVFETHRKANNKLYEFVRENKEKITKVINYKNIVIDDKGNEHHFISYRGYPEWCKGKRYVLKGVIMESGYPTIENR